jgi:hypothetical protein
VRTFDSSTVSVPAALRPQSVEQYRPLDRLRTIGGEVRDQQPALLTGKPRLGRPPVNYDGEPPAQLDPSVPRSVGFNVSTTYRPT